MIRLAESIAEKQSKRVCSILGDASYNPLALRIAPARVSRPCAPGGLYVGRGGPDPNILMILLNDIIYNGNIVGTQWLRANQEHILPPGARCG